MNKLLLKHASTLFALILLSVLATAGGSSASKCRACEQEHEWRSWRGAQHTGEATHADPPIYWSETDNIRWKTELPGLGHSSPVVTGNLVFLTTAIPFGEKFAPIADDAPGSHDNLKVEQRHRFVALAVSRQTGEIVWQRNLHEAIPHEGSHYTASLASPSPLTDGERVYASFGSYGVYALDLEGNLLWEKSLGTMATKHGHGEGSSPALHEGHLLINWDHEGESFLVCLESSTGNELWRRARGEVTSWSSPTIAEVDGRAQAIVSGTEKVRGYDLKTGEIIWECGGLSHNIVATPLVSDGIAIVGSSYEIRAMLAIRLSGATGNVTESDHVIWTRDRSTPYVPSPLIMNGNVYYLSHYQGILSRVDLQTGDEPTGPFRLPRVRDVYASLTAANGHIYIVDRDGVTNVIEEGEIPRIVGRNQLEDRFSATPAFAGNQLILRGERFLYCIEEDEVE